MNLIDDLNEIITDGYVTGLIAARDAELARIDTEIAVMTALRDETVKRFGDLITAQREYGVKL